MKRKERGSASQSYFESNPGQVVTGYSPALLTCRTAMSLQEPNLAYVLKRLEELRHNNQFYGAERAVDLVFRQWPTNVNYDEVLVKVVVLNRLYSTNIWDPYTVAQHIVDLNVDERLRAGDSSLISIVGNVRFGSKTRYFLSFATKYCSWHEPDLFQIFDSYVEWILWQYKAQFDFAAFKQKELRVYPSFVSVVDQFVEHFGLVRLSRKDLDKFLWIEGKDNWR